MIKSRKKKQTRRKYGHKKRRYTRRIYGGDLTDFDALVSAIQSKNAEQVKSFIDKADLTHLGGETAWTPLMYACETGNIDIVKMLVEKSPETVNKSDSEGATPMSICYDKLKELMVYDENESEFYDYLQIMIFLLASGVTKEERTILTNLINIDIATPDIKNNANHLEYIQFIFTAIKLQDSSANFWPQYMNVEAIKTYISTSINMKNSMNNFWPKYIDQSSIDSLKSIIEKPQEICNILRTATTNETMKFYNLSNFASSTNTDIEDHFCKLFLIISVLFNKLSKDANIILKGGKALQLILPTDCKIQSDDIDYIVVSKKDGITNKEIVTHILNFVLWVTMDNYNYAYLFKDVPTSNIIKITYRYPYGKSVAVTDIGYSNMDPTKLLFNGEYNMITQKIQYNNSVEGTIRSQNLMSFINEKFYYINYYTKNDQPQPFDNATKYFISKSFKQIWSILDCLINANINTRNAILTRYGYSKWEDLDRTNRGIVQKKYKTYHYAANEQHINMYILLHGFYEPYKRQIMNYFEKSVKFHFKNEEIMEHIMGINVISALKYPNYAPPTYEQLPQQSQIAYIQYPSMHTQRSYSQQMQAPPQMMYNQYPPMDPQMMYSQYPPMDHQMMYSQQMPMPPIRTGRNRSKKQTNRTILK